MTTKYDAFIEALAALCNEHNVSIEPWDSMTVRVYDGQNAGMFITGSFMDFTYIGSKE